jgi:hypothetical protein
LILADGIARILADEIARRGSMITNVSDFSLVLVAVLAGVAIGVPVLLLGFRGSGRSRCWRCRVWMLPVRRRARMKAFLPVGNCEGCNVWCLALGPPVQKKSTSRAL